MEIEFEMRTETGSNACKILRSRGRIPGTIYGGGKVALSVSTSDREVELILRGHEHTVEASLTGARGTLLLKEIQYDHLGDHVLHLDFKRVAKDEIVEVKIEIETIGTPKGVLAGGILDHMEVDIGVRCVTALIPDKVQINIAELEIGDSVRVENISLPEGVEAVDDPAHPVLIVHAPRGVEEDELMEEGADAETPERIGEKPAEEEE